MTSVDSTSSRAILLADDSPTIRRIVQMTLLDAGYAVEVVANGTAAQASLEERRFGAVLADVDMPGPSGYELCRRIKASSRRIPVLLLVGSFEPFDGERARRCGSDGSLLKPFEPAELVGRIEELLALEEPAHADPDEAAEPSTRAAPDGARTMEPPPATGGSGDADTPATGGPSPELVDAVARAVVERLSRDALLQVAREVVPDLAARIIRERLAELEGE